MSEITISIGSRLCAELNHPVLNDKLCRNENSKYVMLRQFPSVHLRTLIVCIGWAVIRLTLFRVIWRSDNSLQLQLLNTSGFSNVSVKGEDNGPYANHLIKSAVNFQVAEAEQCSLLHQIQFPVEIKIPVTWIWIIFFRFPQKLLSRLMVKLMRLESRVWNVGFR